MAAAARPRSYFGAIVDYFTTRGFSLPPATTSYTVQAVSISVSDNVALAADLYRPILPKHDSKARGTILIQCPYGRGLFITLTTARPFAARGYNVLFVSCRGTAGSGGSFDPAIDDARDGRAVLAWMRRQDWYTGSFATMGASYLGFTQWALIDGTDEEPDPPVDLVAAVIVVGPHDFSQHWWGTGALKADLLNWSDMMATQIEGQSLIRTQLKMRSAGKRIAPVLNTVPMVDAIEKAFGPTRAPWLRHRVTRPDKSDPSWRPAQHWSAVEKVKCPVLLISGWYDIFLGQTIEQYERLSARGVEIGLSVSAGTHLSASTRAMRETLDWIDEHVAGNKRSKRPKSVYVCIASKAAEDWQWMEKWPPATTPRTLFLDVGDQGGRLSADKPSETLASRSFTFDPTNPTPTVGGPLFAHGGMVDDTALAARSDVLTYTSDPLDEDLTVTGKISLELAHSSDNPHVDLFIRVSEVDANGFSQNVTEVYRRLDPKRDAAPIKLDLLDVAHTFAKGARIRLIVAGGSHPQYVRNLGTDENPGTGSTMKVATHTVYHGATRLSTLDLPVLS